MLQSILHWTEPQSPGRHRLVLCGVRLGSQSICVVLEHCAPPRIGRESESQSVSCSANSIETAEQEQELSPCTGTHQEWPLSPDLTFYFDQLRHFQYSLDSEVLVTLVQLL